jgi:hypothetical protein
MLRKSKTLVGASTPGLPQLDFLANAVNTRSDEAWRKAAAILENAVGRPWTVGKTVLTGAFPLKGYYDIAVSFFNRWSRHVPVTLAVFRLTKTKGREVEFAPEVNARQSEEAYALWSVWRFFFHNPQWRRLKRCPQCRRWFVDHSRPANKVRCSAACTTRWWSMDRRRAAGHRLKKQRAKS